MSKAFGKKSSLVIFHFAFMVLLGITFFLLLLFFVFVNYLLKPKASQTEIAKFFFKIYS